MKQYAELLKIEIYIVLLFNMRVGDPFGGNQILKTQVEETLEATYFRLQQKAVDRETFSGRSFLFPHLFPFIQHSSGCQPRAISNLLSLLPEHQHLIPLETYKNVKTILRYYCGAMYQTTRDIHFLQHRFELTVDDFEEGRIYYQQSIPAVQFTSLIRDALRSAFSNYKWVESFLQRYHLGKGLIATEMPKEVYKINRANLLFHQGKFQEASTELIGYDWYGRVDEPQILLLAIRTDVKIQFCLDRLDDDYGLRTLELAEKRVRRLANVEPSLKKMTLCFLKTTQGLFQLRRKQTLGGVDENLSRKTKELWQKAAEQPTAELDWLRDGFKKSSLFDFYLSG